MKRLPAIVPILATQSTARDFAAWGGIGWALQRDLGLALRSRAELAVHLSFYVIVVSLFPLAATPDRGLLAAMAPAVLWVAALLASLLSLPRLFAADLLDGTLEDGFVDDGECSGAGRPERGAGSGSAGGREVPAVHRGVQARRADAENPTAADDLPFLN